ncbi:hypothetical protein J5N97_026361 [Dioscorea zingiberensis]|uniref:Uncharacterized protein n=1 Tax=Dioscorea zingiberensis TaxID=325984 RepID=A0A9D5H6M8_9LILI|nr:hypothetical protein J5N97_026361 [Dioscorea zingiberensis]
MVESNPSPCLPPKPDNNEAKPPVTEKRTRRRAREVSSRYMILPPGSPSSSSSSISGDAHLAPSPFPVLPKAHNHQRKHRRAVPSSPDATDSESDSSSCFADENQPAVRCSDTPLPSFIPHRLLTAKRKPAVRLFSDNAGDQPPQQQNNARKQRPGTPMVLGFNASTTPRVNYSFQNDGRSMNGRRVAVPPRENSVGSEQEACSVSNIGASVRVLQYLLSKARPTSELRSSMPEADLLPTMSMRRKDGNEDYSICHRSLNSALSSCQQAPFSVSNHQTQSQLDVKKVKKALSKHEDIHLLRLLDNRYLQWRFANAKALAVMHARMVAAEKSLYDVLREISELQNSVTMKRVELEHLRSMNNLSTILESQTPILDHWATLEEDYSESLSGTIEALQNASLRLPLIGNVRISRSSRSPLGLLTNMLQGISPSVNKFLPEAQERESFVSELARVVIRERALMQECGDRLSEVHKLQVKECSLRSEIMQLKRSTEE